MLKCEHRPIDICTAHTRLSYCSLFGKTITMLCSIWVFRSTVSYRQACASHKGWLRAKDQAKRRRGEKKKKAKGQERLPRVQEEWPLRFRSAKLKGNDFITKLLQTIARRLWRGQHATMLTLRCWSQFIGVAIEWNHFQTLSLSESGFIAFRFTVQVVQTMSRGTCWRKPTSRGQIMSNTRFGGKGWAQTLL